jgi:hypothetical protein
MNAFHPVVNPETISFAMYEPGCNRRRKLGEDFAIAARLYAEAAVSLALSNTSHDEHVRLSLKLRKTRRYDR